jgi:hypothetical protein
MNKSIFDLKINIISLDSNIERYICSKLDLSPYKSYSKMSEKKINYLYEKVIKKFENTSIQIPKYFCKEIILSIRANLIREHMILMHKKILLLKTSIITDYENGMNILKLSTKYDGSPLNLLRLIFTHKYDNKLTELIKKKNMLSPRDEKQLEIGASNDLYALINQDEVLKKSNNFEFSIQNILDSLGIKYKTQNELAIEQIKELNKAINTPDFLILDDLIINGNKIKWIDAKNFYGLNNQYIKKRIKHQTKKYLDEWGSGAIIFNLGFCSELKLNNILFMDYYSFEKYLH